MPWNRSSCRCEGQPHQLRDCPKPHDEKEIQKNRKAFFEKKRQKGKKGGANKKGGGNDGNKKSLPDWTDQGWPPRPAKGEKNICKIRGVEHYYHFKDSRWKLKNQATPAAAVPASSSAPQTPGSSITSGGTNTRQVVQNVVNNLQSALQNALTQSLQNVE